MSDNSRWRGNILPLALVVMAAIVVGAFTIGFLILQGLLRTRDLDASTVAYYAADSGVERQLYAVRKESADVSTLAVMGRSYANGSSWAAVGSGFQTTNAKFFPSVKAGDFQFVDLFNPDQLNMASGISKVQWTWNGTVGCQLEVGYAKWDTTSPSILPEQFTIQFPAGSSGSGFQNIDPARAYRFRFRPKNCDIANLSVSVFALPTDATPIPFPGDITVAAQGSYGKTTQAISVSMPRLEILSGIFSYVVFSECTLFKDPNGTAPACP